MSFTHATGRRRPGARLAVEGLSKAQAAATGYRDRQHGTAVPRHHLKTP